MISIILLHFCNTVTKSHFTSMMAPTSAANGHTVSSWRNTCKSDPQREFGGLTLYIGTLALCGLYFSWAIFPETFKKLVFSDAPDRYWAVAIPMFLCITALTIGVLYAGYSLYLTDDAEELAAVLAEDKRFPDKSFMARHQEHLNSRYGVPQLREIPLKRVNSMLYGRSH
eukprot:m.355324 g.355324  ORF g.355324 m.355324 type:complete len:170 (+) comp20737_c0_seq5:256-765(+)